MHDWQRENPIAHVYKTIKTVIYMHEQPTVLFVLVLLAKTEE